MITINTLIQKDFNELTDDKKIEFVVFLLEKIHWNKVRFNALVSENNFELFQSFFSKGLYEIFEDKIKKSIVFWDGNTITYKKTKKIKKN